MRDGGKVGRGLKSNERPNCPESGEVILTAGQARALSKSDRRQAQRVEILNVLDPGLVDERIAANPGIVLNVIEYRAPRLSRRSFRSQSAVKVLRETQRQKKQCIATEALVELTPSYACGRLSKKFSFD